MFNNRIWKYLIVNNINTADYENKLNFFRSAAMKKTLILDGRASGDFNDGFIGHRLSVRQAFKFLSSPRLSNKLKQAILNSFISC